MTLFRTLIILFITIPLLELYILIQVGGLIGIIPTIAICIFTALMGATLLRHQGLQTLTRVQEKLAHGETPATELVEGVILLLCGVLLLTPGFFTDVVGFLGLVPILRNKTAAGAIGLILAHVTGFHHVHNNVTIEGEYWEEKQKNLDGTPTSDGRNE